MLSTANMEYFELDPIDKLILEELNFDDDLAKLLSKLNFARVTLLKHLDHLRLNGLVVRVKACPDGRGRPRFLYSPRADHLGSDIIIVPFQGLKDACLFRRREKCEMFLPTTMCTSSTCPLIWR